MPGRASSVGRSSSHKKSSYSFGISSNISQSSKAPIATTQSSVVQHNHQIQQPGFFSNILQGFGLGTGQAIAHNIFRSDPVVKHVYEPSLEHSKEYVQCMKDFNDDKEACKQYLEKK